MLAVSAIIGTPFGCLDSLIAALEQHNSADVTQIIEQLMQHPMDSKTIERLADVSGYVMMGEFEKALELINRD